MFVFLQAAVLFASSARADEEAAESCLHVKIWDGYSNGWQVRSQTNTSLGTAEHRVYMITLYAGNEYKFMACGDDNAANLDLVLYDSTGAVVITDNSSDREPQVDYTPTLTDTYYLAVFGTRMNDTGKKAGVSTAVTYK